MGAVLILSLKFCGKSKKICGDISQVSPAFCMYVFMPETHLPNMPRAVDDQRYLARKKVLEESALEFLGMKSGTEDLQVAYGDLAEEELFIELKRFYTVLQSGRILGSQAQATRQEGRQPRI